MQRVKVIWAPSSWEPRPSEKEGPSPPPRSYRPRSATPTFPGFPSFAHPGPQGSVRLGLPGLSPAPEALLGPGVPDTGGGSRRPEREEGARTSARRRPGAGRAWGPRAAAQAAATSREPTPTWHRARWRFSSQLQRGAARVGGLGVPSPAPGLGRGDGGARELGRSGRRARGRVGMDNQHLGRNWSRWFPPSVSEGSETGPRELEGGSERRVCARAGRGGERALPLRPGKRSRGETALKG